MQGTRGEGGSGREEEKGTFPHPRCRVEVPDRARARLHRNCIAMSSMLMPCPCHAWMDGWGESRTNKGGGIGDWEVGEGRKEGRKEEARQGGGGGLNSI